MDLRLGLHPRLAFKERTRTWGTMIYLAIQISELSLWVWDWITRGVMMTMSSSSSTSFVFEVIT